MTYVDEEDITNRMQLTFNVSFIFEDRFVSSQLLGVQQQVRTRHSSLLTHFLGFKFAEENEVPFFSSGMQSPLSIIHQHWSD
jgi:hypothetical protein